MHNAKLVWLADEPDKCEAGEMRFNEVFCKYLVRFCYGEFYPFDIETTKKTHQKTTTHELTHSE